MTTLEKLDAKLAEMGKIRPRVLSLLEGGKSYSAYEMIHALKAFTSIAECDLKWEFLRMAEDGLVHYDNKWRLRAGQR